MACACRGTSVPTVENAPKVITDERSHGPKEETAKPCFSASSQMYRMVQKTSTGLREAKSRRHAR